MPLSWYVSARLQSLEDALAAEVRRWADLSAAQKTSVDVLGIANQKATDAAFAASQKAVDKAESYNDEWKRNSNEWKAKFDTQSNTMATRSELAQQVAFVNEKLDGILKSIEPIRAMGDIRSGHESGNAETTKLWLAVGTLFVAVVVGMIGFFFP